MSGKLNSLTDVLKKNLFFFDGLSTSDLCPYVQQVMLNDYTLAEIEEKVSLVLQQNPCFTSSEEILWRLDNEGLRENDNFYKNLQKKKQPTSLKEVSKGTTARKKTTKKLAEEAQLILDGRFVQMDDGNWGLTQWDIDASKFSLKHLVIKSLKSDAQGKKAEEIYEMVNVYRKVELSAIVELLKKYPYFEKLSLDIYVYNLKVHSLYEKIVKRHLEIIKRHKKRWQYDRESWKIKQDNLKKQLEELGRAQQEAAAALCERVSVMDQYNLLSTQISEKDLLLSMRKKEIIRFREQIAKLETKVNCILHQCRLWMGRYETSEEELLKAKKYNDKNQAGLETLFTKLQQYKERDRENKNKIAQLKDDYTTRIAILNTEIVELKQKMEKTKEKSAHEERMIYEELNKMSNDLRQSLEETEEFQKSIKILQHQLDRCQEEKSFLKNELRPLPVRVSLKICRWFGIC